MPNTIHSEVDLPRDIRLAIEGYIADADTRQFPWPVYAELRKCAPIYKSQDGFWVITGHRQACQLLRHPKISRYQAAKTEYNFGFPGDPEALQARAAFWNDSMISLDNPKHRRLRNLVQPVFTKPAAERWRSQAQSIAKSLVDNVMDKRQFDFITEIAYRLPQKVICEILNVPYGDHALWTKCTETLAKFNTARESDIERRRQVDEALVSLYRYAKNLIAQRRANMGTDLMSRLILTEYEGERLSDDEIASIFELLIIAGSETTSQFIANSIYTIIKNPDLLQTLNAEPDKIPQAVEELLRMVGTAVMGNYRATTEEIEIDGITIPRGATLMIVLAAANRDPEVFKDPERCILDRADVGAHVAFGFDTHMCLGNHLARMEAHVMLREVVTRLPDLELVGEPFWYGYHTRGPRSLIVRRSILG